MFNVLGMSKISTIKYKTTCIDIWLRERKGKHLAPYVVAVLPDGNEAHIQIKTQKVQDNTGIKNDILNYIKKWIKFYNVELLNSWESSKIGKSLKVPSVIPKSTKAFKVRRIKELKTSKKLLMLIRFENDEIRVVDFHKIIEENPAFAPLKKPNIFIQAKANYLGSAVRWDVLDIDMEAASLYDDSEPVDLSILKIGK